MKTRITKKQFYAMGGFANSNLFRRDYGRGWTYWMISE